MHQRTDFIAFTARLLCLALALLLLAAWHPSEGFAASKSKHKQAEAAHETKSASRTKAKSGGKQGKRSKSSRKASAAPVPQGFHLNVKAAYLMNMSNGKVYYTQNPDERIPPASITKVLTLYLIREALAQGRIKESTPIPVSALAIRTGGSTMSLYKGEKVPLSEIIRGISVVSANNACVAVAEYMGKGDSRKFVAQMNATARNLGMGRSVFKNPNGLPATGQFSTARDIASLSAAYLRRFPESLSIHSMTAHTYHGQTHHNANALLSSYDGADGLKTGFVCASGYNITATAKRGNTRLIAVVLGARNPIARQVETTRLLDYGFEKAATDTATAPTPAPKKQKGKHRNS
ncbi:D-alanyl-D-alanine carboxypeptidase family protein [Fundidesulfovibrio soli]|uniref:D-alanyl-D-alanine carboxypeptidase family protein n=1 Tax=Fundidesulfovibrio soli TaxID=2922716 RepID=UPI001FAEF84F|nr:D-alanyl-D-alanine carboxypeptidase family protein [Fundidesulfovibrio soli]